jgi:hypothetical protein
MASLRLTFLGKPATYATLWVLAFLGGALPPLIAHANGSQITGSEKWQDGSVTANTYTNNFFGLSYTFPPGWYVDKEITINKNEKANKFREDQAQGGSQESDYQPSNTLLTISAQQNDPTCNYCPPRAPSITLSAAPLAKSDRTALEIQNEFKLRYAGRRDLRVILGPADVVINGQHFSRMDTTNGRTFYGDAITILPGYRLEFSIEATSAEDLTRLYKTLNGLTLKH